MWKKNTLSSKIIKNEREKRAFQLSSRALRMIYEAKCFLFLPMFAFWRHQRNHFQLRSEKKPNYMDVKMCVCVLLLCSFYSCKTYAPVIASSLFLSCVRAW